MSETLGDLRSHPDASVALAQASLRTNGYVVVSDSDNVGLDSRFRSQVLPEYVDLLRSDIYDVPPQGRLWVDGLADYVRDSEGSVHLVRDYTQVAIPVWSGNGFTEARIYPNGLPVINNPIARRWFEGIVTLALPELPEPEGSIRVGYFETGHSEGKVVERPHQDGERLVTSSPDFINGDGAVTHLYRPVDSAGSTLEEVATFRLGAGDTALSTETNMWHYVSPLTPPFDGSKPRRRSLIVNIHSPRTHRWLQEFYRRNPELA